MIYKMQSGEDFAIQTKGGGKIIAPNVVTEPQFDQTAAYAVDAKVWYGNVQYVCTTATTAPDEGEFNQTPEEDTDHWLELGAEEVMMASATGILPFSDKKNYSKTAVVMHDGYVWVCSAAHTAGQWNEEHFTKIPLLVNRAINPSTNIAIGEATISNSNGSVGIGFSVIEGNGNVAIGKDATVKTYNAVQLGTGENKEPKSLKFRGTKVVGGDGKIPTSSLRDTFALESVPNREIAASTAYAVGDVLRDGGGLGDPGKAYRCKEPYTSAANPVSPSSDTTHWEEVPVLKATDERFAGMRGKLDLNVYKSVPAGWTFTALPEGSVNPYSSLFPEWDGSSGRWMLYERGTLVGMSGASTQEATDIVFLLMNYPQVQIHAVYSEGGVTQTGNTLAAAPAYNGQNHEFLDAAVNGSAIYGFTAVGAHRWTASRRCIVYLRASHNSDTNKSKLYVHVNNANAGATDYSSMVFKQQFAKNVCAVVPIFLNAGDSLDIQIADYALEQLDYSVFYTD